MSSPIQKLLPWYAREGRDLPWRRTRDPYKIWLSEVILQQTRIDQGTAYYLRFIEAFPNVQALADADTDTLMKLWEGLGYYSRARNLHAAAKAIAHDLRGEFPTDYREWMKLKGVGPYTARAVGSMAFDNPTGVLDGNVFRVLSRYLADFSPIDLPATRNAFQAQLDKWILAAVEATGDTSIPGRFNQAMMDLGATVCTPKRPSCSICPLQQDCQAAARGMVAELPVKSKKLQRKVSLRYYYIIGVESGELLVRRRPPQGSGPTCGRSRTMRSMPRPGGERIPRAAGGWASSSTCSPISMSMSGHLRQSACLHRRRGGSKASMSKFPWWMWGDMAFQGLC